MNDFLKRLESLSPEKRQLMELFLHQEGLRAPQENHVAPRTSVERTLAVIWSEVLGVKDVGIHDNFFALGGDSIHSIQVIAKAIRAGLAVKSTLLFNNPTIAMLALAIEQQAERAAPAGPAPRPRHDDHSSKVNVDDFPEADLSPADLERLIKKLT